LAIEDVAPEQLEGVSDVDEYPHLEDVLRRLLADPDIPVGPVERVEVTAQASAEASYRVWAPRAEEPESGTYTFGLSG